MNTSRIILLKVGLMILKIREKDALAVVVLFCCSIYFVSGMRHHNIISTASC